MNITKSARIWAFIIDALIVGVSTTMFNSFLPDLFGSYQREIANVPITISFGGSITTYFLYFLIFDLFNHGISIGKVLLKLVVVDHLEKPLETNKRIIRTILKLVSIVFIPIAILVYLFSEALTLHEKATHTKTVFSS